MSEPIIELKNVYRSFKQGRVDIPVLRDVNLAIRPGEILCLVGESGCGKQRRARSSAGCCRPLAGR